ncbi:MAG: hypothetical protein Q7L19_11975 [Pseudohongiella sp.]|nr:hypothetical protein [Pseudohongiella sp.]
MAITVEARKDLITLTVGMFNAAPGTAVLSELTNAFEAGQTLKQIATNLARSAEYQSIYPDLMTNTEFATKLVNNMLGNLVSTAGKAEAVTLIVGLLNAQPSVTAVQKATARADVTITAINALKAIPTTDAVFGAARSALDNKVDVATYHSVEKLSPTTSLTLLQDVLVNVTNTAASVTAAKSSIDGLVDVGRTFLLTTSIDNFTGTPGNDTFVGDHTTLTSSDTIVGGSGIDTLNYTDSSASGQTIAASVSGVEIINIRNINGVAAKDAVTETQVVTLGGAATGAVSFLGVAVATSANTDTATQTATKIVADKANIIAGAAAQAAGISDITSNGATVTLVFGNFPGVDVAAIAASAVSNGITFSAGIEVIKGAPAVAASGATDTIAAGSFAGATHFNSTNSSAAVSFTGLAAGQEVAKVGGTGALTAGFGATVAPVVNLKGGTTTGAITVTGGTTSVTINSSEAVSAVAGNSAGALTVPATVTALTVNAASSFTATSLVGMAANSTLTAAGAGSVSFGTTTAIPANVATINGSALTGGITAKLNNNAIVVTGGNGNDTFSLNANTLTTGTISAGTGTDTLIMETADVATLVQGNKLSGFEVVRVIAGSNQNFDFLATNNTFATVQMQGAATLTNVPTSVTSFVALNQGAISIGIKGALTPGQIDTVNLTVSDGTATVQAFTFAAPALAGVEVLNITNVENTTIGALTAATALTNVNVTGGATAPLSITTGAMALQTNFAVNASGLAGNFTFNATGATTNGFSVTGGSGTNAITGGNQIFSANLNASTAKADVITVSNATGGTAALANAKVTGFVASADAAIADKIVIFGAATAIQADIAVATATGIANLTGTVTNGIMTFAGTAAATATLADKLTAAASLNFAGTVGETVAFVHGGDTYIFKQVGTADAFDAGTDVVVQLVGVTNLTALSLTAAANAAFVG